MPASGPSPGIIADQRADDAATNAYTRTEGASATEKPSIRL